MSETNIFALVTALGVPILVFIGGLISWFLKNRKEELKAIEERALEKRIETYNKILNPFITLFSAKENQKLKDKALDEITSIEYRKAGFNLITFGSDEMVNAYNDMMQGFYKGESNINPNETMRKFANFLLSIRKDIYNKDTKLKEWDMLKFMITDIDEIIKNK